MSSLTIQNAEASKVYFIELLHICKPTHFYRAGALLTDESCAESTVCLTQVLVFSQQLKRCLSMSAVSSERQSLPCEEQSSKYRWQLFLGRSFTCSAQTIATAENSVILCDSVLFSLILRTIL